MKYAHALKYGVACCSLVGLALVVSLNMFAQSATPASNGAPAARAAPAPVDEGSSDEPIRLDVTRVNLLFTVTDKKGRFISNFKKEDFQITENKKKQEILEFTAESDLPLRLAFLIDTSNSIRDRFRFLQESAIEFIETAMRADKDKAMIVGFDSQAQLIVDLTTDKTQLVKAVKNMRAGGGTALYDAIAYASREKLMMDQPRDKYRRAIIILSDGEDNLSKVSRDQAVEWAQKADAVIYCISTNGITNTDGSGDKVLKYFAVETGGMIYRPFQAEDMQQSFVNITNELRHQYNVLYRPEPLLADGKYHSIDIQVKTVGDMVVRARQGYYAPEARK